MDKEEKTLLRKLGSFQVSLVHEAVDIKETRRLRVHDSVLRPLLAKAIECRIYDLKRYPDMLRFARKILTPEENFSLLDLSKETIRRYERLWNSCCERGSIAIAAPITVADARSIFRNVSKPQLWSSLYQIHEGNSKAAIRFCQQVAKEGGVAFCLPETNGIEWMDIFAASPLLEELYALAKRCGMPEKRFEKLSRK